MTYQQHGKKYLSERDLCAVNILMHQTKLKAMVPPIKELPNKILAKIFVQYVRDAHPHCRAECQTHPGFSVTFVCNGEELLCQHLRCGKTSPFA